MTTSLYRISPRLTPTPPGPRNYVVPFVCTMISNIVLAIWIHTRIPSTRRSFLGCGGVARDIVDHNNTSCPPQQSYKIMWLPFTDSLLPRDPALSLQRSSFFSATCEMAIPSRSCSNRGSSWSLSGTVLAAILAMAAFASGGSVTTRDDGDTLDHSGLVMTTMQGGRLFSVILNQLPIAHPAQDTRVYNVCFVFFYIYILVLTDGRTSIRIQKPRVTSSCIPSIPRDNFRVVTWRLFHATMATRQPPLNERYIRLSSLTVLYFILLNTTRAIITLMVSTVTFLRRSTGNRRMIFNCS